MTAKSRVLTVGVLFFSPFIFAQPVSEKVSFEYVQKKAQERSAKSFDSRKADLPDALRGEKLNYDSYREIEFRHDKALWVKEELPFRLEFFHLGYLYQNPVKIHEFTPSHVQEIRFVQDFFDYRKLNLRKTLPADTGYAGFKLLYRLNNSNQWDEVASFLGTSYFRMLGKEQHYGQSARGLALNSGETDHPEEFPLFTDWWLGKPEKEGDRLRFYGILDSISCVGAFEFLLRPGENTIADVEAVVYMREPRNIQAVSKNQSPIRTFGMAPLTSMFWYGENSERKPDDYRPEVHDSDGLLIRSENGDLLWRPLSNPSSLQHQTFAAKDIRGFGLLQRDRDFDNYEDMFNSYHRTPSVWVEPRGKWGEGSIHLVELPTRFEGFDNVVAFWDPKQKPQPMQPFRFTYTLHWGLQPEAGFSTNTVLQTRIGADPRDPSKRQIVIDFGEKNNAIATEAPPEPFVRCGENATVSDAQVFRNTVSKSWRVIFSLNPKAELKNSVDIQCGLKRGDQILTETWTYRWNPPPPRVAE
jgi:periplasmic glucans biosynthesis protein